MDYDPGPHVWNESFEKSRNNEMSMMYPEYKPLLDSINDKLAGYKRPYAILNIDKDDIPRSTTGKVQRHLVEEMVEDIIKKEYKEP